VVFNAIADLPATAVSAIGMAFDHTSATVGGRTSIIHIPVHGDGVYRSTDTGVSFARTTTAILDPTTGKVGADGSYYLCHRETNSKIHKYASGSWTQKLDWGGAVGVGLACHPTDANRLVAAGLGTFRASGNGGDSWTSHTRTQCTFSESDAPWQDNWAANVGGSNSGAFYDPQNPNVVWITNGQGVWSSTYPTNGSAPTWTGTSLGIEELVTNEIMHVSGSKVLMVAWDEATWMRDTASLDAPPTNRVLPWNFAAPIPAWSGYIDPQNPDLMVHSTTNSARCGSYDDSAGTFTAFANVPAAAGAPFGCICVNNGVTLWQVTGSQDIWRSTNLGATAWAAVNIPGIPATSGWHSISRNMRNICADFVDGDTFYASNHSTDQTVRGIWRSQDAGVSFTRMGALPWGTDTSRLCEYLGAVPGNEGHLFATTGHVASDDNPPVYPESNTGFFRSVNGGANWSSIANVSQVSRFGFGKARVSGGYPTIFIAGFYRGVYGIYMSEDQGASWHMLVEGTNKWPLGLYDAVYDIDGDKDVFGRGYIALRGNGAAYFELAA
jgi:xyloglucan-specific exo-beta-1,4-glucanase